jgi:hypothetical protein
LQECDCQYEKNQFEECLLLSSEKSRRYQKAIADIPHSTSSAMQKQIEMRSTGPKVGALSNRFEMV